MKKEATRLKRLICGVWVAAFVMLLPGVAMTADTTTVAVSATVIGTCKFSSGGTMAFGNLDPSNPVDVNATVTQPVFWCTKGATYTITDDDGLYESGTTHQVKHATLTEYIPYSFTYTASGTGSGPATTITMDIAGTIVGTDYQNASAGDYSDTVTLSITP